MSAVQGLRMKRPAHPGGFVKSEIIEPLGLSVTDAARALGVTRPALSAFLNERAALSPEMALRIEKAFGMSMDTLIQMQCSYDIAEVRQREGEIKVAVHGQAGIRRDEGMTTPSQYADYELLQTLAGRGRIARKVEDLDDDTVRAIAASSVTPEFAHLDALVEDWKPPDA